MQLISCALLFLAFPQGATLPLGSSAPSATMEIPLWPEGSPGAPNVVPEEVRWGEAPDGYVRDVHVPTITVYQPKGELAADSPGRSAVIICPGGGYSLLSIDKEGHEVAQWFAERGICGVVLKSRLPRPSGHVYGHAAPLADVEQAMQLLRENKEDWSIDAARIGVMGFSAGGHLAATAAVHIPSPQRPAFAILIYPVISMRPGIVHEGSRNQLLGPDPTEELLARYSCEEQVGPESPPTFLVHTSDDPVNVMNSVAYYTALQKHSVPSEMHIYDRGGHGYGMRNKELPVGQWPMALERWMKTRDAKTD